MTESNLRATGDPGVLQQVIADLCRNETMQAEPGDRLELRVERKANHVWLSVLGPRGEPAELSQQAAQRVETALSEAGGSFTVSPVDGHVAYVAVLPLRPVVEAERDTAA